MDIWGWFAEIKAAEWLTIGVALLAAVATIAAVWVSVRTAAQARRDAMRERARADLAKKNSADAQLKASQMLADAHREIERDRLSYTARADAEKKASAQAMRVTVRGAWQQPSGPKAISPDFRSWITAFVTNESDDAITDVTVKFERAGTKEEPLSIPDLLSNLMEPMSAPVRAGSSNSVEFESAYVEGHRHGDPLFFTVEFSDIEGHRWRLTPDRVLMLLNPRVVRIAET